MIGFFLRAIRICNKDFLEEEFRYLEQAFGRLGYPRGMIKKLRGKAIEITNRGKDRDRDPEKHQYLSVPHSKIGDSLSHHMKRANLDIVRASFNRVGNKVRNRTRKVNERSVLYSISYKASEREN